MYGRPGPDAGYALKLVQGRDLGIDDAQQAADAEAALAAVAAARASHFGRAPTSDDLDIALLVFGFLPEGLPEEILDALVGERGRWFSGLAHSPAKAGELVSALPVELLNSSFADLSSRMGAGERIVEIG